MEHNKKPRGNPIIKHIEAETGDQFSDDYNRDIGMICNAAVRLEGYLPSCAELSVGLRHILDAVTAFKRAKHEPHASIASGDMADLGRCQCKISFYGEWKNANMIKITDIIGIETYCDPTPSEIILPLPLPPHYRMNWHNVDGFEVLEVIGAQAPTFIPCSGYAQIENICSHLNRPVPQSAIDVFFPTEPKPAPKVSKKPAK